MFQFRVAERIINEWMDKQSAEAKLMLLQLQMALRVIALTEHDPEEFSQEQRLSFAWEDLQVTCSGHGNQFLTGALLSIWGSIPRSKEKTFQKVLKTAFGESERLTPGDVERRYELEQRLLPPILPSGDWADRIFLPSFGARTRAWAIREGLPPNITEEFLRDHLFPKQTIRSHLSVVE